MNTNFKLDMNSRQAGILLHPTSLPSPYGIGDLGKGAYDFIDFLKASGQRVWQVLPLGPTGYGDSPYQSFSSFAGQPLLISPASLIEMGLLHRNEVEYKDWNPNEIDYGSLIEYKTDIFKKAFAHFDMTEDENLKKDYRKFCTSQRDWLTNYALFMAAKDYHNGVVWTEWENDIAFQTEVSVKKWTKKLAKEVKYYKFLQYIFFKQWFALKAYANENGIAIIGDTPIFVAFDSCDVWADKDLFQLDAKGHPIVVAGVPPDYFSETGQLWGNPLYKWNLHKETGYKWWINRIEKNLELVDILRIDHFRGFDTYWEIPYGEETAIHGKWILGPKNDIFEALQKELGNDLPIIAEDLGELFKEVFDLRDAFDLPGMNILQFAFEDEKDNNFMPHHHVHNSVTYTGTHDNDTTLGWYTNTTEAARDRVRRYMNTDGMDICWDFIRTCFNSTSKFAIIPMQDILSLDSSARMNTPGKLGGNWAWRFTGDVFNEHYIGKLRYYTELGRRLEPKTDDYESYEDYLASL